MLWNMTASVGPVVLILISVAFFSLFERKVLATSQARIGPNKVFVVGFFQPMADALKLLTKVESTPSNSEWPIYSVAPCVMMLVTIVAWSLIPIEFTLFQSESSMVIFALYFSVTVYGVVFSGWSSNSRYATLGCVRAITQSISFEIGLSTVLVFLMIFNSSTSASTLYWNKMPLFFVILPISIAGILCLIAEMGRTPFDLPEGESELVSGYSVEYGGGKYTIIFLSENMALLLACKMTSTWFFGGWLFGALVFSIVLIRAALPRVRYDKMMFIFWCSILPLLIGLGGANLSFLWSKSLR